MLHGQTIAIWDVGQLALPGSTTKKIKASPKDSWKGHTVAVNRLLMTNKKIVIDSVDRTIRVESVATLTCVCFVEDNHEKGIVTPILSPGGTRVTA
jgi:hypothetical protein